MLKKLIGRLLTKLVNLFSAKKRNKKVEQTEPELKTQQIAKRYCLGALGFFGLQSIIALGGGLDLIFPDFPSPVNFQDGRSIHLNLSIFWPTFGLMGITYYFFIKEVGVNLYSIRLARLQFWLFLLSGFGFIGTLAFGLNDGREYLEAIMPLRLFMLVSIMLFAYNLFRTYLKQKSKKRPTAFIMLTGVVSSVILFAPNLAFFFHPSVDDYVRFWVVHMWEELSFELVGAGVTVGLLLSITNVKRETLEKLLYIDASLIVLTGMLATGHHYYWIGTPGFWLIIGGLFSTLQVIPTIIVFYVTLSHLRTKGTTINNYIVLGFLLASGFWHVTGAGLLGLLMAVPSLNLYLHGTLVTSSHSHLALFGVFGLMVLGGSFYILTKEFKFDNKNRLYVIMSFFLINLGLLVMGIALFLGGLVQTYLWRVAGIDFMEVQILLKPYHIFRGLGGLVFTFGALVFCWSIYSLLKRNNATIL